MGKKIGYMRVSTDMQVHDLQQDALQKAGVALEDIYSDVISGAKTARVGLDECLKALQPGDTLVVWKLDRLGRSVEHLKNSIDALHERGVQFQSLRESIDTSSATGKLFFHILAAMAEFERDMIAERVRAGMEAAKARGVKLGPPAKHEEHYPEIARRLEAKEPQRKIAEDLGVSKTTVQRVNAALRHNIEDVPELR